MPEEKKHFGTFGEKQFCSPCSFTFNVDRGIYLQSLTKSILNSTGEIIN